MAASGGAQDSTEQRPVASIATRLFRAHRLENHLRRLWAKVNKNGPVPAARPDLGPCWIWTGQTNGKGYGQLCIDRLRLGAHDFFYRLLVGPVPGGLELDHLCRVKLCVNPVHLEPAPHRENMRRAPVRDRRAAPARDRRAAGLARAAALTPERRSEIARLAARARWVKAIG
jgi:hypothetical protein